MVSLSTVYYGNTLEEYIISLAILALAVSGGKLLYFFMQKVVKQLTKKTQTKLDDIIIEVLEKPILLILFSFALKIGFHRLHMPMRILQIVDSFAKILFMVAGTWIAMSFVDKIIMEYLIPYAKKTKTGADVQLIPLARKAAFWIILIIALMSILSNLGVNISSLLAGLGLGGLAIALAAEKTLSNVFGGITILTDGPFKIRQRIRIQNHEGYVQEIGMRSTRLESLDGPIITIPNSVIVNEILENVTKRMKRRVMFTLGLTYNTSTKKLEEAKKILQKILSSHKEINDFRIGFTNFNTYALDIMIIYWIPNADNKKMLEVMHEINLEILKRFNAAKLSFAFPTQTVEVKRASS